MENGARRAALRRTPGSGVARRGGATGGGGSGTEAEAQAQPEAAAVEDAEHEAQERRQAGAGAEAAPAASQSCPVLEDVPPDFDIEPNLPDRRKEELTRTARNRRLLRLTDVWCNDDPEWWMQLLQLASPHLEELQIHEVYFYHFLLVLTTMPRLRRLSIDGDYYQMSILAGPGPSFPELPAFEGHLGLRWLDVAGLPRDMTLAVLRAHASTLEELMLWVGTPSEAKGWPYGCGDLHAALGQCGLNALRRLVLRRPGHDVALCPAQLSAVRGALQPGVQVQCNECDGVTLKF